MVTRFQMQNKGIFKNGARIPKTRLCLKNRLRNWGMGFEKADSMLFEMLSETISENEQNR